MVVEEVMAFRFRFLVLVVFVVVVFAVWESLLGVVFVDDVAALRGVLFRFSLMD